MSGADMPGMDVVVVGNVGIDTQVFLPGREIDFRVESNFTKNLDCVGQAGGYCARGYARLGKSTAFVGAVGDDAMGRWIMSTFHEDGVDTRGVFIDPEGTSRSINFMYPDGRRRNFYDGKSHMTLQPDQAVMRGLLKGSRLAHFHIPDWARRALPLCRESSVVVAVDLQDVPEEPDAYRDDFLNGCDIVFLSAVNLRHPVEWMRACLERCPAHLLVAGMGSQGAALATREKVELFPAVELPMPVCDSNGAGDSLAVGFLSAYVLEGYSAEESLLRGQTAARWQCAQYATSSRLITAQQLQQLCTWREGESVASPQQ